MAVVFDRTFLSPFSIVDSALADIDNILRANDFKAAPLDISMDVEEHPAFYQVEAELPGFDGNDVCLELNKGVLTVSASKKAEAKEQESDGRVTALRRSSTSYRKSIRVPEDVDLQGVTASMDKGLLTLSLPKIAEKGPRRIPVSGASDPERLCGPSSPVRAERQPTGMQTPPDKHMVEA